MKIIYLIFLFGLLGCATVGEDFTFKGPRSIKMGVTSQRDILNAYGRPYRVGYDSGLTQWTYATYEYRLFGGGSTKDLIIVFNKKRRVARYIYNSSLEDDKIKILVNQTQR